jgi:hypothetical protein
MVLRGILAVQVQDIGPNQVCVAWAAENRSPWPAAFAAVAAGIRRYDRCGPELLIDPDTGYYAGQRQIALPGSLLPVEPGAIVSTVTTVLGALEEFPTGRDPDDRTR